MNIDEVITLDDNKEYVLLSSTVYEEEKYFLATLLENGKPTENYEILKEVDENGEIFVDEVKDQNIKDILVENFEKIFDEMETNN